MENYIIHIYSNHSFMKRRLQNSHCDFGKNIQFTLKKFFFTFSVLFKFYKNKIKIQQHNQRKLIVTVIMNKLRCSISYKTKLITDAAGGGERIGGGSYKINKF